jgi:hypothetical protein
MISIPPMIIRAESDSEKKKNPSAAAKMIREEETMDPALAVTCLYPMVSRVCPIIPIIPLPKR